MSSFFLLIPFSYAERSKLTPAAEPDPSFYEPTISDVQSYQSMITGRSKQLNEAPFMTSKQRDAEKAAKEQKKADKWPTVSLVLWKRTLSS